MWSYTLPIITAVLALLLYLTKDWHADKKCWRVPIIILIIITGIGGAINNGYQDKKVGDQHDKDQKLIGSIKEDVGELKSTFIDAFSKEESYLRNLSSKINDLKQSKMSAAEFQKKADQLKADIDAKANQISQTKQEFVVKVGAIFDATVTRGAVQPKSEPEAPPKSPSQIQIK